MNDSRFNFIYDTMNYFKLTRMHFTNCFSYIRIILRIVFLTKGSYMKKSFIVALLAVGLINANGDKVGFVERTGIFFVGCKDSVVNGFVSCKDTVVKGLGSVASVVTDTQAYKTSVEFVGNTYADYGAPAVAELTKNPTRQCGLIATSAAATVGVLHLISKKIKSEFHRNMFRRVSYAAVLGFAAWKGYKSFPAAVETVAPQT